MSDALFLSALATLSTVIGVLWKVHRDTSTKSEKRTDKIEALRERDSDKMMEMSGDLGELRGEIGLAKKVMPKLDDIHADIKESFLKK